MNDLIRFFLFKRRLKRSMEQTHQLPDPWSAGFQRDLLHRIVDSTIADVDSILEIGSGDGVVSEKLLEKCQRLTCVELSTRAIKKAKQNLGAEAERIQFISKDIYDVSLRPYSAVVLSFMLEYLGMNQFSKRFVWLMLDICRHTNQIVIIQPIHQEIDMKRIETVAVILYKNGFELLTSQIEKESTPHLYVGSFAKSNKNLQK